MNRKRGFTLLELMIVVIIVGILASLALPRFIGAAKKARESEAISMLGAIRASQLRYYLEHSEYHVDTDIADEGSALDLDITSSAKALYTYGSTSGANDIIATATRTTDGASAGLDNFNIEIDGTVNRLTP
ncbi:MAG: prepilin-type N-terminal cleavage/methylation domain-containing protein [Candidatus Omnitrophota bacterium]|nr:MAG: prepilin-type N-terminal cleavage/methylation domain-containing protein [Candidatus Omnitrophota bacterium]